MNEGANLTRRDHNQIPQYEHDETNNAKRVFVVGQEVNIDTSKLAESLSNAVKESLANFQVPVGVESIEGDCTNEDHLNIIEIEKQVFIPQIEYKTLEVPVIIKEIEYREIEKQVIVYKTEFKEVDRPVYITEFKEIIKEKDVPRWQRICITIQTVTVIGVLLMQILSHIK